MTVYRGCQGRSETLKQSNPLNTKSQPNHIVHLQIVDKAKLHKFITHYTYEQRN